MTVDVGNKELVEVHVPKTGKVADIMQQLRWDKDLYGRSLANENGAIVSCTFYNIRMDLEHVTHNILILIWHAASADELASGLGTKLFKVVELCEG